MQILIVIGVGAIIYAVFGMFTSDSPKFPPKRIIQDQPLLAQDFGKEQKIQRLQSQIAKLESQLEQSKVATVEGESGLKTIEEKEAEFSLELKRREEWVAKAEAERAKTRTENLDLNNKFIVKENELQEEFKKNVDLNRQVREIKAALEANQMACRLKEDQLQAQKHQSESQLKSINEYLATIAEFKRKEKISEWVPKAEFSQLNAEYAKLEQDLADSQERLKSFAAEIAHLRQLIDKESLPAEEIKQEKSTPEDIRPPGATLKETKQEVKKLEMLFDSIDLEKKTKETEG
ncbi:MAG: hypothetical protein NTX89_04665 [Candidatus Omnitrophica bacterium]|nr:hypothetical protein [Candidatus Omnitrophota bacterium]